jgi:hypothetical protein
MSAFGAQSGHSNRADECLLLGKADIRQPLLTNL